MIQLYIDPRCPFCVRVTDHLEARGIALFDRIESEDFTAIEGLPLLRLVRELARLGVVIP